MAHPVHYLKTISTVFNGQLWTVVDMTWKVILVCVTLSSMKSKNTSTYSYSHSFNLILTLEPCNYHHHQSQPSTIWTSEKPHHHRHYEADDDDKKRAIKPSHVINKLCRVTTTQQRNKQPPWHAIPQSQPAKLDPLRTRRRTRQTNHRILPSKPLNSIKVTAELQFTSGRIVKNTKQSDARFEWPHCCKCHPFIPLLLAVHLPFSLLSSGTAPAIQNTQQSAGFVERT